MKNDAEAEKETMEIKMLFGERANLEKEYNSKEKEIQKLTWEIEKR